MSDYTQGLIILVGMVVMGAVTLGVFAYFAWVEYKDGKRDRAIGQIAEGDPCKGCLEECECDDPKCGKEGAE